MARRPRRGAPDYVDWLIDTSYLRRAEDELRRAAAARSVEKDMGTLEYDPRTGVYRPARRY